MFVIPMVSLSSKSGGRCVFRAQKRENIPLSHAQQYIIARNITRGAMKSKLYFVLFYNFFAYLPHGVRTGSCRRAEFLDLSRLLRRTEADLLLSVPAFPRCPLTARRSVRFRQRLKTDHFRKRPFISDDPFNSGIVSIFFLFVQETRLVFRFCFSDGLIR